MQSGIRELDWQFGGTGTCLQTLESGGLLVGWADTMADWIRQTATADLGWMHIWDWQCYEMELVVYASSNGVGEEG